MTRRIALAILATVWAILIAGCATAYLTIRWELIDQLDQSLEDRASSFPELRRLATAGAASGEDSYPPASQPSVRDAPAALGAQAQPREDRYVIKNAAGQTLSPLTGGRVARDLSRRSASFTTLADGTRMRIVTLQGKVRGPGGAATNVSVIVQGSAESLDRTLRRLAVSLAAFGICAGLVTALVALWVSRRALRPLYATADVIGTIDSSNLHRRIEVRQLPPELVPMATRLNEMLERIERDYAQRQQFLADASHELRTPVAALVTTAEVSLRHPREALSYRKTLETCLADARLLRQLVERLMEQCRADTLSHDETPEEIDLVPLLEQCADHAATLGAQRGVTVERVLPSAFCMVTQPQRLRSIVMNLLANAVEYNRVGGSVELGVRVVGQLLHLTVGDTGPGVEPQHLPHLFEPFYRGDKARSSDSGHLGLGLSLVQSHVLALGGQIRVESVPGEGTRFEVILPLGDRGERPDKASLPPVTCANELS